jgi:MinD-like ATPase involved in chromosome partitioning or flagellar assembly
VALIALVSAKGSPGVTTLAMALANVWPRRVLVAECDPAGGDLAAGYLGGQVDANRGLLNLTVAARRTNLAAALPSQLVALDDTGSRCLLPGLQDPALAAGLVTSWERLAEVFAELGVSQAGTDVLADCGRLTTAHLPTALLRRADTVVLVLRPSLRSIAHAQAAFRQLRQNMVTAESAPVVVLVGEGRPYASREVARALAVPVHSIAHDPGAAAVFTDASAPGRRFLVSPLLRSARTLADDLARRDPQPTGSGREPPTANGQFHHTSPHSGGAS